MTGSEHGHMPLPVGPTAPSSRTARLPLQTSSAAPEFARRASDETVDVRVRVPVAMDRVGRVVLPANVGPAYLPRSPRRRAAPPRGEARDGSSPERPSGAARQG